jgi:hypothetical protein
MWGQEKPKARGNWCRNAEGLLTSPSLSGPSPPLWSPAWGLPVGPDHLLRISRLWVVVSPDLLLLLALYMWTIHFPTTLLEVWRWRQYVPAKRWYLVTSQQGVTTHKTNIDMSQNRFQWRAVANTVMGLLVPCYAVNFLTSWATVSFSWTFLWHGV